MSTRLEPGSRLAEYEILAALGQGSSSIVYKAVTEHGRVVAIKVLHPHLMEREGSLKRFQQEAAAASLLSHPNIVQVGKYGTTENGMSFLLMEFIAGRNLGEMLKERGRLDSRSAIDIGIQIASAMQHAHMKGVLHRNLKPNNIMLKEENGLMTACVVDFGVAKLLPHSGIELQQLTQLGHFVGTPIYMSPEQCAGQPVDERSDIYSLGCMLYELICGHPPFQGEHMLQTMAKHLSEEVAPFAVELGVDPHLRDSIFCMLTKRAADRYQSMSDLKIDLEQIRDHGTSSKKLAVRKPKPKLRRQVVLLVCGLSIVSGVGLYLADSANKASDREKKQARAFDPRAAEEAIRHFYDGQYKRAESELTEQLNLLPSTPSASRDDLECTLAQVYLYTNRETEAEELLRKGLKQSKDGSIVNGYYEQRKPILARVLLSQRKFAEAEKVLQTLPPRSSHYNTDLLVQCLVEQRKIREAEQVVERVAQEASSPDYQKGLVMIALASAYEIDKQHEKALNLCKRILKLPKDDASNFTRAEALYVSGVAYRGLGKLDAAIAAFAEGAKSNPFDPCGSNLELVSTLVQCKKATQAVEIAKKEYAKASSPGARLRVAPYYALALGASGNVAQALDVTEAGLKELESRKFAPYQEFIPEHLRVCLSEIKKAGPNERADALLKRLDASFPRGATNHIQVQSH